MKIFKKSYQRINLQEIKKKINQTLNLTNNEKLRWIIGDEGLTSEEIKEKTKIRQEQNKILQQVNFELNKHLKTIEEDKSQEAVLLRGLLEQTEKYEDSIRSVMRSINIQVQDYKPPFKLSLRGYIERISNDLDAAENAKNKIIEQMQSLITLLNKLEGDL